MPFNPQSFRTLATALLLICGVSVAAPAQEEVTRPSSLEAEVSAAPDDSEIPGIDGGAALLDRLRLAQEVLGSGVPEEAERALDSLIRSINTLLMRGAVVLPASYQFAGELWMPVKADRVRVRLGVPEILSRPDREARREGTVEPLVEAFRIDWLPLERTRTLLTNALQGIRSRGDIPPASRERLAEALAGIRQTTRLQDPVMEAYRAVKTVLASGETWQDEGRDDLRQAADGLSAADTADPAARELGSLAEAPAPEVGRLVVVAAQLRARIAARQSLEASPVGTIQPAGSPAPEEDRTGGRRPGSATGVSGHR